MNGILIQAGWLHTSTTALYSYLVLTWVYKRDTYAQRQGATNTIAKSQGLLGGLSTLSNHFHTCLYGAPYILTNKRANVSISNYLLHLSQTAGTVTMESMISIALLYLLFWINCFLPHSCISLVWISFANYLAVLREFFFKARVTVYSYLAQMVLCGYKNELWHVGEKNEFVVTQTGQWF